MGAPELPDPGEEDLRPTEPIQHAPTISDESDNESVDAYDGYQPLAMDEADENTNNADENAGEQSEENNVDMFPNLAPIQRVETEITRELWNAPRPQESLIELDNTRTTQILNAMANFTLPNATIPDWAINVPEEHWKEELLQRIRHRKEAQANGDCQSQKESNERQD